MKITDVSCNPSHISITSRANDEWATVLDQTYTFRVNNRINTVVIPRGFEWDGASIPRLFWRVAGHPMQYDTLPGALLHDFCFTNRPMVNGRRVTFEESAELYMAFNKASGASWFKRTMHNVGVLSPWARKVWNAHDEEFEND